MKEKKLPVDAEQDARKVLEELRATLYSIGDGVIATDAAGHITRMNPVAESLTGWSEAEAHGKPLNEVFRIINEKTRTNVESPVERVLREGQLTGLANHTLLIAKDGTERPIADSGAPIRGERGEIAGAVLVFRDQTAERAAQRALRESEERYRALYEDNPSMYFTVDPAGTVLSVNQFGCEQLGYTPEELLGQCVLKVFHDEDKDAAAGNVAHCVENPGQVFHWELRKIRKAGSVMWVKETSRATQEPDGTIIVYIVCEDITERKQAEEALRESEERHRSLVDASPMAIIVYQQGIVVFVNPAAVSLFGTQGCSSSDLVGRKVMDFVHPDSREIVGKRMLQMRDERKPLPPIEERYVCLDGREILVELAAIPFFWEGEPAVQAVARDVTQEKKLEAQFMQAQKMEAIGRLAGGVAHDFNNMLVVIMGYTELALEKVDPTQSLFANLQEIRKAAEHSADLTRQLLAFARKQTVAPKVLDLNETVEGMLKILRRLIGENINLAWLPGPGVWPVKVDPSQIDQILANLCVNARDAIAEVGKVTIETQPVVFDEAYCADHQGFSTGEYVLLAVSDNGCGMDKETLDKLFEPFFTTKEKGKGTGLGLATVYGIVKQNNGFINVYSEPGKGTNFKVYIPRLEGQAPPRQMQARSKPTKGAEETVLLVEDELMVLQLSQNVLEQLGYKVLPASTPVKAIQLAEEYAGKIDLLITDVVMPEMNGLDLAERLLSTNPKLKQLFMSGYTGNGIAHHGLLDEGVHFIQKPFSIHNLAAKVREVLDQKST